MYIIIEQHNSQVCDVHQRKTAKEAFKLYLSINLSSPCQGADIYKTRRGRLNAESVKVPFKYLLGNPENYIKIKWKCEE